MRQSILLTGATGLLGRYLLRDLLVAGYEVAVVARDRQGVPAAQRVKALHEFAQDSEERHLPRPLVLPGDLTLPGLGLGAAERHLLASRVRATVHSAAQVGYQATPDGEPWETNVNGTRRLLELCRSLGVSEMHHLSTAFVCGDRRGVVHEDELDCGNGSVNVYEQSKFAGEQLVRQFPGSRATIYRPSVVVGDSRTGYTSTYHHLYRFLELAVRLSAPPPAAPGRRQRQRLPMRLPLTGEETQNLVPVDWVSRALVALINRPQWHGRTFHLVACKPISLREIKAMVEELLQLEGIRWAGRHAIADPTPLEQLVLEQFKDYWSYLHNNLQFDCRNTSAALPDLPPPTVDRALMERLLAFAEQDRWGRRARHEVDPTCASQGLACAHYLERVLPERIQRFPLAQTIPEGLVFRLDIAGPGGGVWSCRWRGSAGLDVRRGADSDATTVFHTDSPTLEGLVAGRLAPQAAFFDGRIQIDGDKEQGLKLAAVIEQFLGTSRANSARAKEPLHVRAA
jgi:thioester reductase-like protein